MAILKSILGQISGSIGEMTMHRQKGTRSVVTKKVTDVANPNTVMQRNQRIKMQPAALFYNAYENVLNHSRQGLQIGNAHRQAFMKEVLKGSFTGVPYVVKGTNYFVPGRYPMSKGGLNRVNQAWARADQHESSSLALLCSEPFDAGVSATMGKFSKCILDSYAFLQEGDELTFVWAEMINGGRAFVAHVNYVSLDTTDTTPWANAPIREWLDISDGGSSTSATFCIVSESCVAGCIIVSRKVGKRWQYSQENMDLRSDFAAEVYSEARYNAAVLSYTAAGANAINSPYILQQSTNQQYRTQIRVFDAMHGTNPVSYMASVAVPVGGSAASGTIIGVFTDDGKATGAIIDEYGNPLIDAETGNVKPSDIGWTGQTLKWEPQYIQQVVR